MISVRINVRLVPTTDMESMDGNLSNRSPVVGLPLSRELTTTLSKKGIFVRTVSRELQSPL